MNKEIIKKYKDVFDYWLNDGKVLFKDKMNTEWIQAHKNHEWGWSSNIYIKNDEYVEFRKALADGKRIQYKYKGTPDNYDWMGFSINDYTNYMFETKYIYRIKPDEPKFKVGDWVRIHIDNNIYQLTVKDMCSNLLKELWQPQENEYVYIEDFDMKGVYAVFRYKDSFHKDRLVLPLQFLQIIGTKTWKDDNEPR